MDMNQSPHCQHCHDGAAPASGHIRRAGRAHYVCRECGRDVTTALLYLVDAELGKWSEALK